MKLRSFRRKLASIVGLIGALFAVVWLFASDTQIKSSALFLFITLLPLIGGGCAMISSYSLGNAESKAWLPLDIFSCLFAGGFVGTFFLGLFGIGTTGAQYLATLNRNSILKIVAYVFYGVGIILFLTLVFSLVVDLILYFTLDRQKQI